MGRSTEFVFATKTLRDGECFCVSVWYVADVTCDQPSQKSKKLRICERRLILYTKLFGQSASL